MGKSKRKDKLNICLLGGDVIYVLARERDYKVLW